MTKRLFSQMGLCRQIVVEFECCLSGGKNLKGRVTLLSVLKVTLSQSMSQQRCMKGNCLKCNYISCSLNLLFFSSSFPLYLSFSTPTFFPLYLLSAQSAVLLQRPSICMVNQWPSTVFIWWIRNTHTKAEVKKKKKVSLSICMKGEKRMKEGGNKGWKWEIHSHGLTPLAKEPSHSILSLHSVITRWPLI